jgi:hypothetical protein
MESWVRFPASIMNIICIGQTVLHWKGIKALLTEEALREIDSNNISDSPEGWLAGITSFNHDVKQFKNILLREPKLMSFISFTFAFKLPASLTVLVSQLTNISVLSRYRDEEETGLMFGTLEDWFNAIKTDYSNSDMRELFNRLYSIFRTTSVSFIFDSLKRQDLNDKTFTLKLP